ncbi:MAG TPA: hypothetical protein DD379_24600 [Cyanobacteria bacterium UBA11162]|nr:hypothetical protein [Cyanobacteria bacterium UBA11162]
MKNFPRQLRHGSGTMMTLDPTRLLLAFREQQVRERIEPLLQRLGLIFEDDERQTNTISRPMEMVNHTKQRFWVRTLSGKAIDDQLFDAIEKTFQEALEVIHPVYRLDNTQGRGGLLSPLSNVLVIKLNPQSIANNREVSRVSFNQLAAVITQPILSEVPEKSKYLGGYRYYLIENPKENTAYQLQQLLLEREKQLVQEARFENMPMLSPLTVVPNDTLFAQQWDMTQIDAPQGWDISTGSNTVVVAVIDSGCDLSHPDLQFSTPGIDLGTMMPDGSPNPFGFFTGHGTSCAGIVAARFNNVLGVAGVAGSCQIMPLAFQDLTDVEVALGINYAADNGATVLSMSFGAFSGWDFTIIDPAITHAVNDRGCVLCAATGNDDDGSQNRYPARHPLVIACGASDQADNRKSPASPDGEVWGSNYGVDTYAGTTTGVSVVAPGVLIPSTDIQGSDGFDSGDYVSDFNGTSSATPHVAGLAALIISQYPSLTNIQVRNIIERTAEKVGTLPYAEVAGFPNGTRNQEMGYGRINVLHALDFADVLIKDYPGDTGTEPSTGGNFWDFSDIVTRITDDNVFVPEDPSKSKNVERGQTNYLYIRVTNNGPTDARNVVVNARITPFVGTQFVYPADWTLIDATHISPTPVTATFATIPAGSSAIAKFTISAAQVEELYGWTTSMPWHPCLLASVNADNDYAFATADFTGGTIVVRRNNLAQRNLSVIDVLAGAAIAFPFLAGNLLNAERMMEIRVDRTQLPKDMKLLLAIDDDGMAFPRVDLMPNIDTPAENGKKGIVYLERTRIETTLGCCRGILTLEKGSRFDCLPVVKLGKISVKGGDVILRDGKRFVEIREAITTIQMEKQPNQLYPLALQTSIPAKAQKGQQYTIKVAQLNQKEEIVGGATVVYVVD